MASSIVGICNDALAMAQASVSIASLEQDNKAARECKLHYEASRDFCLEVIKPYFAIKRVRPAQSLDDIPLFGFKYAYDKPADFLFCLDDNAQKFPEKWKMEGDYLLTDSSVNPDLIYIAKITEVSRWSETFKHAVTCQLALRIAPNLSRSQSVVIYCDNKYIQAESIAKTNDRRQISPGQNTYISTYEKARRI